MGRPKWVKKSTPRWPILSYLAFGALLREGEGRVRDMAKMLKQVFTPVFDWCCQRYQAALGAKLKNYGMRLSLCVDRCICTFHRCREDAAGKGLQMAYVGIALRPGSSMAWFFMLVFTVMIHPDAKQWLLEDHSFDDLFFLKGMACWLACHHYKHLCKKFGRGSFIVPKRSDYKGVFQASVFKHNGWFRFAIVEGRWRNIFLNETYGGAPT